MPKLFNPDIDIFASRQYFQIFILGAEGHKSNILFKLRNGWNSLTIISWILLFFSVEVVVLDFLHSLFILGLAIVLLTMLECALSALTSGQPVGSDLLLNISLKEFFMTVQLFHTIIIPYGEETFSGSYHTETQYDACFDKWTTVLSLNHVIYKPGIIKCFILDFVKTSRYWCLQPTFVLPVFNANRPLYVATLFHSMS